MGGVFSVVVGASTTDENRAVDITLLCCEGGEKAEALPKRAIPSRAE